MHSTTTAPLGNRTLVTGWREGLAIVNLRGDPGNAAIADGVSGALGLTLPAKPCSTTSNALLRILWAGPDDFFVIGSRGQQQTIVTQLRSALTGQHHAVTDVSSGYQVLQLAGVPAREVLAQGCPLDLHPRSFREGDCKGSHFFKASTWVWQTDAAPTFELLVRRSFAAYVELMLAQAGREFTLVAKRFAS